MFNLTFHKEGYENSYSGDVEECPKPRIKLIRGDTVEYIPTTTELVGKPEMCIVDGVQFHYLEDIGWQRGTGRWNRIAVGNMLDNLETIGTGELTLESTIPCTYTSYAYENGVVVTSSTTDYLYPGAGNVSQCAILDVKSKTVHYLSNYSPGINAHGNGKALPNGDVSVYGNASNQIIVRGTSVRQTISKTIGRLTLAFYNPNYVYTYNGTSVYTVDTDNMTTTLDNSSFESELIKRFDLVFLKKTLYGVDNVTKEVFELKKDKIVRVELLDNLLTGLIRPNYIGDDKVLFANPSISTSPTIVDFKNKTKIVLSHAYFNGASNQKSQHVLVGANGYSYIFFSSDLGWGFVRYNVVTGEIIGQKMGSTHHGRTSAGLGINGKIYVYPRLDGSGIQEYSYEGYDRMNPLLCSNILCNNQ